MAAANVSSEKIDLLIYGPVRPILENGFSDQYVLHMAESRADLERLTPDTVAKIRRCRNSRSSKSSQASGSATITSIPPTRASTISSSPTRPTC